MKSGDVDTAFKENDGPLRIVFVCAMWLTGFDVPSCATILDKPMRNHTLMQTIARANRVYPGKLSGLIVDYVGVFRNTKRPLPCMAGRGRRNRHPVRPKEEQIAELAALANRPRLLPVHTRLILRRSGAAFHQLAKLKEAREALIYPDEVRKKFLKMAGRIERLFGHG